MQLLFTPIVIIFKDNLQKYTIKYKAYYQHNAIQKA